MPFSREDVRALSRRSLVAQRAGFLAMLGTMMLFPLVALVGTLATALTIWALYGAAIAAGGLFAHYAWRAGEARGAFRRAFREEKQATRARRVEVEEGPRPAPAPQEGPAR